MCADLRHNTRQNDLHQHTNKVGCPKNFLFDFDESEIRDKRPNLLFGSSPPKYQQMVFKLLQKVLVNNGISQPARDSPRQVVYTYSV